MSKNEVVIQEQGIMKSDMSLNSDDVKRLVDHLAIVKQVVSEVMREGKDGVGDYGITTGTGKRKALYKPGAEKLMKLFGLGVRFKVVENIFRPDENFALYSYEAEVYHLRSGTIIATCEGVANSQELKYREKAVYTNGVKRGVTKVNVCDILNTLKKMAQKRAMVGAVIVATGASDYFTQDEDEIENQQPTKKEAAKADASRFNQETNNLGDYIIPVGKFKDKKLSEIETKDISNYVEWVTKTSADINGPMKLFIDRAREYLRGAV